MSDEKADKHKPHEKPVSLAPLEFEEALRDLLAVKPDDESPAAD